MTIYLRRNWPHLLLLTLGLLLLGLVLAQANLAEVRDGFRALSLLDVLLLMAVNILALAIFTGRWWLFLFAQGYRVPFVKLVTYRLAAFGVSYFTPGPHFGGEPLQVYFVTQRHQVRTDASIAAVTMDKLFELIVNFSFLAASIVFVMQSRIVSDNVSGQALFYALVLLALPVLLLALLWNGRHPLSGLLAGAQRLWPSTRLRRWQTVLRESEIQVATLCRQKPSILLAALGVSLLSWMTIIGEYWLTTRLLGLELTLDQALLALVAIRIAILLPMPAGLGALEASQVLAMQMLGYPIAVGATIGLIIRARDVLLGLLGLWIGGVGVWSIAVTSSQEEPALVPINDPAHEPPPLTTP